ncbi:hypothetical protein TRAPUB_3724 [Trametes pubescens]|uniref:F-box domain-containing protein n=1 Tax=Trametes pubescens TaxID=154538 RepID=A0A1M2VD02_TRAPU|nr:hypothetical protein TRAPUB_3724 [Trametes pubescens]
MPSQAPLDVSPVNGQNADGSKPSSVLEELVDRSMRNIAGELMRLRQDNTRLQQNIQQLNDEQDRLKRLVQEANVEIALLRKEKAAFKGASQYLIEQTGYMPPTTLRQPVCPGKLPHEVLIVILRATRAPRYQLNPSVAHCRGWKSAWLTELRCRKGLMSVCKWWSGPAMELFYEDIVLRRMGQILALADMLTANMDTQRSLAQLVKSIRLDTCVVLGPCAESARDAMRSILSLCTALQTFEYHTAEGFSTAPTLPPGDESGVFNPTWFVDHTFGPFQATFNERMSGLMVLDIAMPLTHKQVAHLHELLCSATRLETLKVGRVQSAEDAENHLGALRVLQLPQLTALYVPADDARFVAYLAATWEVPRLARLTTLDARSIPYELLAAHGVRLLYLHLCPLRSGPVDDLVAWDIERIVELCPLVEHLVLPGLAHFQNGTLPSAKPGSPPGAALRYVDIWSRRKRLPALFSASEDVAVHRRYLPANLLHPDLPAICNPRIRLGDSGMRTIYFPGIRAMWSKHIIVRSCRDSGNMGVEADMPPDYCPESDESDSEESEEEDSSIGPDTDESEDLSTEEYTDSAEDEEADDADDVEGDGTDSEASGEDIVIAH